MRRLFCLFFLCACAHPQPTSLPAAPAVAPQSKAATASTERLPDFTLTDLSGAAVRSQDLQGKIVLLDFWSSTCGPCIREFPALEAMHRAYQDRGLVVIGVSLDADPQDTRKTVAANGLTFQNLLNGEPLYLSLGGHATPYTFLVDGEQHVLAKVLGRRSEEFFEGLLWTPLSLSTDGSEATGVAAKDARTPKPAAVKPIEKKKELPALASAANGWTLERIKDYDGELGALFGVRQEKGANAARTYRLFAGGNGAIFSSDGDSQWTKVYSDPQSFMIEDIWGASDKDLFAVGENSPVLYSSDRGSTWTAQGERLDLYAVWGSSSKDLFAAGDKGLIVHSSDGGKTWQRQSSDTTVRLNAIWGAGPNDVYIGGAFGVLLHSSDGGKTWEKRQTKSDASIYRIWGRSADDIYLAGGDNSGVLLRSTDRGQSFSAQTSSESNVLGGVMGASGDIWASGGEGYALRSSDAGKTWDKVQSIPNAVGFLLWVVDEEVVVAGPDNVIQRFKR